MESIPSSFTSAISPRPGAISPPQLRPSGNPFTEENATGFLYMANPLYGQQLQRRPSMPEWCNATSLQPAHHSTGMCVGRCTEVSDAPESYRCHTIGDFSILDSPGNSCLARAPLDSQSLSAQPATATTPQAGAEALNQAGILDTACFVGCVDPCAEVRVTVRLC